MISTRKSKGWNPSKNLSIEKFSKKSYVFTCDDVHDEEEEGSTDAPGGGGHDLHDHREQDGEPGLRKQVVQGWREYSYLYCVDIHPPSAMKQ